MKKVYEFDSYKSYLLDTLKIPPYGGRGSRARLASAISSKPSYVAQILNGDAHLSLEQVEATNDFLNHDENESEFFLFLVMHDRAGTTALKKRMKRQIEKILVHRKNLSERLQTKNPLDEKIQATYFSDWSYAAIHALCGVESIDTTEKMALRLGLPIRKLKQVLAFLREAGLVVEDKKSKNGLRVTGKSIHLSADSPLISKHHINWRFRSVRSLENESNEDLHYSSVVALSKKDCDEIYEIIVKKISEIKNIVRNTQKNQELQCFSVDFFKL